MSNFYLTRTEAISGATNISIGGAEAAYMQGPFSIQGEYAYSWVERDGAPNVDFNASILRLANIVGPRSGHGVIYDFIMKLRANPKLLEVLGDGTQSKSYLYIDDCVEAVLAVMDRANIGGTEIFNVGSEDRINVLDIARIAIEEMKLRNVEIKVLGGVDGGRGWKGDVKEMLLDISKLKDLGWKPAVKVRQGIRRMISWVKKHKDFFVS